MCANYAAREFLYIYVCTSVLYILTPTLPIYLSSSLPNLVMSSWAEASARQLQRMAGWLEGIAGVFFCFHCIFDIYEFKNPDNCPGLARHVRSRAGVRPAALQSDHSPAAGFVELRRRFGLVSAEIYLGESAGWKKHYSYLLSS